MKYLSQFAIIVCISFVGEILNRLLPLPVPASIWGFLLLFMLLKLKVLKLRYVKDAGDFLLDLMPVMFVPPSVGVMTAAPIMKKWGVQFCAIAVLTTFCVIVVSGRVAQFFIRLDRSSGRGKPHTAKRTKAHPEGSSGGDI